MSKNIDRDIMLMALLTKGIEIIDIEEVPQYTSLKKTLMSEISTIRTRLNGELGRKQNIKEKPKLSDDDKQFIIDELLGILGGTPSGIQTYTPNPSFSKFFGDYLKSNWNQFDDEEDDEADE